MRTVLNTILACLILACPFVCGAAEDCCDPHQGHSAGERPGDPSPIHCPDNGAECVCRGAVPTGDVKVPHADGVGLPDAFRVPADFLALSLVRGHAHFTSDGHPAGLAGWGDGRAVRAFLQNFRC